MNMNYIVIITIVISVWLFYFLVKRRIQDETCRIKKSLFFIEYRIIWADTGMSRHDKVESSKNLCESYKSDVLEARSTLSYLNRKYPEFKTDKEGINN